MMDRSYRKTYAWSRRGKTRRAVLDRQGNCCAGCGWSGTDGKGRGMNLCHLIPHPLGSDDESNLVGLCPGCHRRFDAGRQARLPPKNARAQQTYVSVPGASDDDGRQYRGELSPNGDGDRTGPLPATMTPGAKFPNECGSRPSPRLSATRVDPVQNGNVAGQSHCVGAGSPAFPAGFKGVWGDDFEREDAT
jgi:hypothetical protein